VSKKRAEKNSSFSVQDLIKKYGNRYAFEWYVRSQDGWYWKRTNELLSEMKEQQKKKIAVFTVINTAISGIAVICSLFLLCVYQEQFSHK
jgi:hypothetical protein